MMISSGSSDVKTPEVTMVCGGDRRPDFPDDGTYERTEDSATIGDAPETARSIVGGTVAKNLAAGEGIQGKLVRDPRKRKDTRRRKPESMLKGVWVTLLGGARSLKDAERRSSAFSKGTRRLTGTHRRIPDTTIRDFVLRVSLDDLRAVLRRQCLAACRRKALPAGEKLPFHAVSSAPVKAGKVKW